MTDKTTAPTPDTLEEPSVDDVPAAAAVAADAAAAVVVTPVDDVKYPEEYFLPKSKLLKKIMEQVVTPPESGVTIHMVGKPHHITSPTMTIRMKWQMWRNTMIWAHGVVRDWYAKFTYEIEDLYQIGADVSPFGTVTEQQAVGVALSFLMKRDVLRDDMYEIAALISNYYSSRSI